ncbi:MAG TPA: hypothetical protein VKB29_08620 [Candidatus Binataceae bacterium]|nr:hypothetical protein [Candidatus Binataceae bacterium]
MDGAETILQNYRFIDAARTLFRRSTIRPTFIVVNLNAPMPAGPIHVDVPTFRGATREQYPLGWLIAMGRSELFDGASFRRGQFHGSMTDRAATLNTGPKDAPAR